jgi:hypothetical protein
VHTDFNSREKYYNLLKEWRYKIYKFDSDTNYRGQELKEDDMITWQGFDIFAVHENNL